MIDIIKWPDGKEMKVAVIGGETVGHRAVMKSLERIEKVTASHKIKVDEIESSYVDAVHEMQENLARQFLDCIKVFNHDITDPNHPAMRINAPITPKEAANIDASIDDILSNKRVITTNEELIDALTGGK